jgi:hypothetical protein
MRIVKSDALELCTLSFVTLYFELCYFQRVGCDFQAEENKAQSTKLKVQSYGASLTLIGAVVVINSLKPYPPSCLPGGSIF